MSGLAVIFFLAALGFGLSRWWRLPVIPLLLAEGVLASAFGYELKAEGLDFAVELGLTFLAFAVGIELNPRRVQKHRGAVFWVGLCQLCLAGGAGILLARLLGFDPIEAIYVGFALSTSSTLVVVRYLRVRQQMFEPFGRLVVGVLLFQDLIMIVLIVIISRIPGGPWAVLMGFANTVFCGALAFSCQRYLIPKLILKINPDPESLLLIILAILFGYVGLVDQLGLPAFAGAFMAGFSLSAFPVNGLVRGILNSLSDFFIAVFFVGLGMLVQIPVGFELLKALAFALLVILLTPPLVTLIAEWHGLSSRAAIETGLYLAQNSEFSLILAFTGVRLGQVTESTLSIITAFTVTTMMCTPFIATDRLTRWLLHLHPIRRRMSTEPVHQDHVLMLGFGSGGMWVFNPLRNEGYDVLVVDDDPVVIEQLEKKKIPSILGDGSDPKILEKAGARRAKLILASMRRANDAEKVLRYVRGIPTIVRVFEERDADRIRALGGIAVLNSEASLRTFLEWFQQSGVAESKQG